MDRASDRPLLIKERMTSEASLPMRSCSPKSYQTPTVERKTEAVEDADHRNSKVSL